MKHLNKLVALLMLLGLSSQAQDSNNKWAIGFGANAVDGARVSAASSVHNQFSQYFDARNYWNIIPSVSYVNVSRYVGDNFSFGVTGSVNKISKLTATLAGPGPAGGRSHSTSQTFTLCITQAFLVALSYGYVDRP